MGLVATFLAESAQGISRRQWREDAEAKVAASAAGQCHDAISEAMRPRKGQILGKAAIARILGQSPGLQGLSEGMRPEEHCLNQIVKCACPCAQTDRAIFKRVGWGKYRVL